MPTRPIRIPALNPEQLDALEELYRTTGGARLRTRAQMVLLATERRMSAAEITGIVRACEKTVRRWVKRYLAEGVDGLRDAAHPGSPRNVTAEYRKRLVNAAVGPGAWGCRSRCGRYGCWPILYGQTGIRVEYEIVRAHLKTARIVLSPPQHTNTSPDPEYALKKGDRRNPRRSRSGRSRLLRRRVPDAHPQGHVERQGSSGDDLDSRPTQKALRHRCR